MSTIPPPWGDNKNWTLPDGKFKPGQSGNPSGRSLGTKNKRTLVAEVLELGVEDVARAMLTEAKNGDVAAAKLVLERIVPPLRNEGPRIRFQLNSEAPVDEQARQVMAAMANGEIDIDSGKIFLDCLSTYTGLVEHTNLVGRIATLEQEARAGATAGAVLGRVMQTETP